MERTFSQFEAIIFSLLQLKEKYDLEFEIETVPRDMDRIYADIFVTLRKGRQFVRFRVTRHMLEQGQPGFLDNMLQHAVEEFQ
ncbi:MAG: hypothetical protein IJ716_14450 [Lachnospiraceae bacterium]|nr:hypothetical protein [Lachnospiraceae bacterium]